MKIGEKNCEHGAKDETDTDVLCHLAHFHPEIGW